MQVSHAKQLLWIRAYQPYNPIFFFFLGKKNETKKAKNEIQPCFFYTAQTRRLLAKKRKGSLISFTPTAPLN
jgi:hypothetical protein